MKRTNSFWITAICVVLCLLGTVRLLHTKPVHAQQNTGETYTGEFYLSAYIDVDGAYNAYATSAMQSDDSIEAEFIGLDAELTQDAGDIAYDSDSGYEEIQFSFSADGPVTPGHYYGTESDGYSCYNDDEEGTGDGDDCDEIEYVASAYASVYVEPPPPIIDQLSPSSANQGDHGQLTITGRYLIQNSSDQLTLTFTGPNNTAVSSPFTLVSQPSTCNPTCTATYSYDLTYTAPGQYHIFLANNEASSDGASFTVNASTSSAPSSSPPYACAVTSNPQAGYSSIVSTGALGGSGTIGVSFGGAAYSGVNPSVPYGPYSTPNSIAAHMAALITKNYFQFGLSAKAFGASVVYSGNTALGTVNTTATGPSFAPATSSSAASNVEGACDAEPPQMPSAVITLKFTGYKNSQDRLIFGQGRGACTETLGLNECPADWGWNLEGRVMVTDDASKWTVRQQLNYGSYVYKYRSSNGTLQDANVSKPAGADGPQLGFMQQSSGTRTIFWINDPQAPKALEGPIDSGTLLDTFSVSVCSIPYPSICANRSWVRPHRGGS